MKIRQISVIDFLFLAAILLPWRPLPFAQAQTVPGNAVASGNEVLAVVNGHRVTRRLLSSYREQLEQGLAGAVRGKSDRALLDSLVDEMILAQEARSQGFEETTDVKQSMEIARYSILARTLTRANEAKFSVTNDQLRQEFEDRLEEIWPTRYHVRQIIVEERSEAAQVIDRLRAGGDFGQLARDLSQSNSGQAAGTAGWITLAMLPEPLREPVGQIEPGQYTGAPIESEQGWHVVRLEGIQIPKRPKLEEVPGAFDRYLRKTWSRDYLDGLRDRAEIQILIE